VPNRQREDGPGDGITVLIADAQELSARRLKTALSAEPDIVVVGECSDGEAALRRASVLHPEVAIVDVSLTVSGGTSAAEALRDVGTDTRVVVLVEDSIRGPGEVTRGDLPAIVEAIQIAARRN
jgi:DNA-binding NarL/FixJ family response regulator